MSPVNEQEVALRESLGIPAAARQVLVVGESTHWDPNWLKTSEEYYRQRVEPSLDRVLVELHGEPQRVFCLECVFFLRMYWERRPDSRAAITKLMGSGRLRMMGSGLTTPDTLLPPTEAILRDYALGQHWLDEQELGAAPRVAYFPDSFGHSPALPSVLAALGFEYACVTRIDGMYFPGSDYRLPGSYPDPGSSAERLLKELRTVDFVWRGPDGAQVLCHWNAWTYFQGDMLSYRGIIRWMGRTFGWRDQSEPHVARQIDAHVARLGRVSPTPYRFLPIGCDFNDPIPGLWGLLDRYNHGRFRDTGTWVVSSGLDDYLDLVACHRDRLPILDLDPNPYWMGFYASRPEAKQRGRRLVHDLLFAEKLAAATGRGDETRNELREAWDAAAVANHHDFVTGTAPDRIWHTEQLPMLQHAQEQARALVADLRPDPTEMPVSSTSPATVWRRMGIRLTVEAAGYRVELDQRVGGCITSWRHLASGRELVVGPGCDLVSCRDDGGLWRLGHELRGGRFQERGHASDETATLAVGENQGVLRIDSRVVVEGQSLRRTLWIRGDSPIIRGRIEGALRRRRTLLGRLPLSLLPSGVDTEVVGGVVRRPLGRGLSPTFWPCARFAHVRDERTGVGVAFFLGGPAALSVRADGVVDWMALRNAPWEKAWGVLPIPAHPASGTNDGSDALDFALVPTESGDWLEAGLHRLVDDVLDEGWLAPGRPDRRRLVDRLVTLDDHDVELTALKPAENGRSWIARLRWWRAPDNLAVALSWSGRDIVRAERCDARERSIESLPVVAGSVSVIPRRAIETVRLHLA